MFDRACTVFLARLCLNPVQSKCKTNDGVLEMANNSARFWNRIAKRYAKQAIADEASYQKKLAVTQQYLRPEMEVLEFGCGTGSTALIHAPHVRHIRAIDISSKMIDIAQTKAAEKHVENLSFEQANIEDLTLACNSLDAVMGLSILHLLENKEIVVAKVFSILKPGGIFISSTACLGGSLKWLRFVVPIGRRVGLMPFVSFFSQEELKKCLLDAGFAIDYAWQPGEGKALFIVAKKPE